MTWLWIGIAAVVLFAAASQGDNRKKNGTKQVNSHWIYHPHVIESDQSPIPQAVLRTCCFLRDKRIPAHGLYGKAALRAPELHSR